MNPNPAELDGLASEYAGRHPRDILSMVFSRFDSIAVSFSGAEDVVLVDMATRLPRAFDCLLP